MIYDFAERQLRPFLALSVPSNRDSGTASTRGLRPLLLLDVPKISIKVKNDNQRCVNLIIKFHGRYS